MSTNKNTVRFICLAGIMAAKYVGLDYLAVTVSAPFGGNLKISLSGLRSYIACRILQGYGYDAFNFAGGFRFYDAVTNDQALIKQSSPCGMDK